MKKIDRMTLMSSTDVDQGCQQSDSADLPKLKFAKLKILQP